MKLKKIKKFKWFSLLSIIPFLFLTSCGTKKPIEIDNSIKANVIMKADEAKFYKTPKHFFYIMVDSLTSSRFLDSYNHLDESDAEAVKEKEALKDFNLKMNVVSPDYGTSVGLGALLSGAKNAAFVQELRRKSNVLRKDMMQEAWNNLFTDIGNQENIKKIYANSVEYYETQKSKGNLHKAKEIEKKELNLPDKIKSKIVLDTFSDSHDYYNSENFYKILDEHGQEIKKESNFTYINTLVVHDNFDKWNYNNYHPPYGNKVDFFKTLEVFIDKLKKLQIYNDSEIMIVSDHGKQNNSFSKIKKSNWKLQNQFLDLNFDTYSLKGLKSQFVKSTSTAKKSNKDLFYSESPLSYMTSIIYKPINANNKALTVDYKNLYYSGDSISQLYYDMYIPTDKIEFNFFKYMKSKKGISNKDGSYDSFVNDPFHKDLSKRILFSLRKNAPWGLRESLYLSNKGMIWKGPFWKKDAKGEWILNNKAIIEFVFDNASDSTSPWLDKLIKDILRKQNNAYSLLGTILDKFPI